MNLYELAVAKALSGSGGGGGGASGTAFSGEFIAEDTTGNQEQILEIPYEGTGFPMGICFSIEEVPTASAENANAVILFVGASTYLDTPPTYNAGYYDKMHLAVCQVNAQGAYQTITANNTQIYKQSIYGRNSGADTLVITSATTFKLAVEQATSGKYGFRIGKKYHYTVVYSA